MLQLLNYQKYNGYLHYDLKEQPPYYINKNSLKSAVINFVTYTQAKANFVVNINNTIAIYFLIIEDASKFVKEELCYLDKEM